MCLLSIFLFGRILGANHIQFATKLGRGRDNTPVVLCSFMLSKLQYRIGNGLTYNFLDFASVIKTVIHPSCCSVRFSGLNCYGSSFRVTKQIESVTGKDGVSITLIL